MSELGHDELRINGWWGLSQPFSNGQDIPVSAAFVAAALQQFIVEVEDEGLGTKLSTGGDHELPGRKNHLFEDTRLNPGCSISRQTSFSFISTLVGSRNEIKYWYDVWEIQALQPRARVLND